MLGWGSRSRAALVLSRLPLAHVSAPSPHPAPRAQYRSPWGSVRVGRILEDLDSLAGYIAYDHWWVLGGFLCSWRVLGGFLGFALMLGWRSAA